MAITPHDMILRHAVYLEGLKNGRFSSFNTMAGKLNQDVRRQFANLSYDNFGLMAKTDLRKFIASIKKLVREHFSGWLADLIKFLENFCRADTELLSGLYEEIGYGEPEKDDNWFVPIWLLPIGAVGVGLLPEPFLKNFTGSAPVHFERRINQGYMNNMKPSEVVDTIMGTKKANFRDGLINTLANQSQAAVDTVLQHVASQINQRLAEQLTGRYQWISVLDSATTEICRSRANLIYEFGRGPVPPAHIRCRSSIVPYKAGQRKGPETFREWTSGLPDEVRSDMFGEQVSSGYQATGALTLGQFVGKRALILAE